MHEVSIMQSTLQLAEEYARKAGGREITRIRIRVGLLSGVVPESLEFAFEMLKKGSMAENGQLEIARTPALFECANCKKEWKLDTARFLCPECEGALILRGGGNELELDQLEVN